MSVWLVNEAIPGKHGEGPTVTWEFIVNYLGEVDLPSVVGSQFLGKITNDATDLSPVATLAVRFNRDRAQETKES